MESKDKVALMMTRFVHRGSPFATQKYYEEDYVTKTGKTYKKGTHYFTERSGSCTHTPRHAKPRDCSDCAEVLFTEAHLLEHLLGKKTYAPYQISDDGKIKWVCFDVDGYEVSDERLQERVVALVRRIQESVGPRHALVEKSGNKGYHVWVFFDEPLPVTHGYTFAHTVVNGLPNDAELIVEVYPKQPSQTVLGSTVKLPLGIHQKTGERCFFVNNKFEFYENQWEVLQGVRLVSSQWIIDNFLPTPVKEGQRDTDAPSRYLPLCLIELLDEGCGEGVRDEAAFRLSCYLKDRGLNQEYAELVLSSWNTKNKPPLDDSVLQTKVESGYSRNYPWLPCMTPGFDMYCQSSCYYFKGKVEKRWFITDKSPVGEISRE